MGSGGGGGSSGKVDFPTYQKDIHKQLFFGVNNVITAESGIMEALNHVLGNSPFADYTPIETEPMFFGPGYDGSHFPALWDMFGKFMAGLDIEVLWSQVYNETIDGPELSSIVAAHAADSSYDLLVEAYPRFHAGMRDINAVQSSAFAIGRSIIENSRHRDITKFAANIRTNAFQMAQARWGTHLDWNKTVIAAYQDMFRLFFQAKMDTESVNRDFKGKDIMWDLRAFEYPRSMIGALQGGALAGGGQETSQVVKSISGTAGGAATGAVIGSYVATSSSGGPWGAVIGGVVGLAASFF